MDAVEKMNFLHSSYFVRGVFVDVDVGCGGPGIRGGVPVDMRAYTG